MKKGITIAGNMIVDHVKTIDTYPKPGMLVNIVDVQSAVGGCAPNTIIDLAKIDGSLPLCAIGKVGNDDAGRLVLDKLVENGIDISKVRITDEYSTSFSDAMCALDTGERTFFHHRGANAVFSPDDIEIDSLSCDIMHIGYILLLDSFDKDDEEYGTVMARFLKNVQEKGIRTSIDVVSGEGGLFRQKVLPALKYCDYAIMNEIEGCAVSGLDARDKDGKLIIENIRTTLELFVKTGVKRMAVLHSPEAGFCMNDRMEFYMAPSFKLSKDYIKGSVGAGDAFCAGCLYGLYNEYEPERMLKLAAAAAAANLSRPDSVSGMVKKEVLEDMIRNWEVNEL
ncbi:MAG: carbohydrate kinase family protein [Clostridiales bacterium]|nr:carbohydrate kinase family protein [Clostridiales bacterium]